MRRQGTLSMATLGLVWIALAYPAFAEDLRQGHGQPTGTPAQRTSRMRAAPELAQLRAQAGELVRLSRAAERARATGRRSFVSMVRALSSPELLKTIPSGKAITIVRLPTVRHQHAGGISETIDELVLTSYGPGQSRRETQYEAKVQDLKEKGGKLVGKISLVPGGDGRRSFTRLGVTGSDKPAGEEAKDSEVYLNGLKHTKAPYAHDVSTPWTADSFMTMYRLERPAAMRKAMVRVRKGIEALSAEHKRELRTRGVSP